MGGGDPVASWLRPEEFSTEPRLFFNEWQVLGVAPSVLPNHNLLAAANIVAGDPDVIKRVYLSTEHAAHGFYVLRFFHDDPRSDDDWKVVLVDDRLPCGADGRLLYAHSLEPNEMWVPLLEKAFAKLYGSYESLVSGFADTALRDLSGGAPQRLRFGGAPGAAPGAAPSPAPTANALWRVF